MVENSSAPMNVNARLTQYTDGRVWIAVRERHQQRDGGAERRNLRERQIDEDDAALDDVHAQIGVDAGEDQAGGERRREKREHRGVRHAPWLRCRLLDGVHQQIDVVVEEREVVA